MKVSVIMTVYNQSFVIVARAIESVCKQTFQESIELIIVDDGSEADLGQTIQQHIASFSNTVPIRYIYQHNQGQASALNNGIKYSQGTFIAILDADDEYSPQHIAQCYAGIDNHRLICSDAYIIANNEDDYYVPDKYEINALIHINDCVVMGTLFGERAVFESIPFEEHRALDALFYDTAKQLYPNQVHKLALCTYIYYRNSPTSKTNQIKQNI